MSIAAGETFGLARIDGPGTIQSMWFTGRKLSRDVILRIYWDDQTQPSVEAPLGDFFTVGWGPFAQVSSLPVAVNPNNGLNCFWEMPFRTRARLTLENRGTESFVCFYQINYSLTDDDDAEFPTICGTGTEDYFGGAYDWVVDDRYVTYTTPFLGMHQVLEPDGVYRSQMRFGMYRWHIADPIRFAKQLRVTLQALGWRSGGRYLPLQCDMASVAYWYQTLPTAAFPELPDRDYLEVI